MRSWRFLPSLLALVLALSSVANASEPPAQDSDELTPAQRRFLEDDLPPQPLLPMTRHSCSGGSSGGFPCNNVSLAALVTLAQMSATDVADVWGWVDPLNQREYAIVGLNNGAAFVDVTDAHAPIYLGKLPPHTSNSIWRVMKVYNNYAFVGSEATGHGMQIFDLTRLRNVVNPPVTFTENAFYGGFGRSHTTNVNEQTGFIYSAGSRQGTNTCNGGLHMVNVQNPLAPTFAGCVANDGYVHETQCTIYNGPDTEHVGKEICFNCNEDTVTIVDVTNKNAPVQLSRTSYTGVGFTHQGWLTEDHRYFLLNDELDEVTFGHNGKTYIWDMVNLDAPTVLNAHLASTPAIDHNLYIKGSLMYQASYRAGLRIYSLANVAAGLLTEVGYFDVWPADNNDSFNGAWSVYPYLPSGRILVGGIEQGLFVLEPLVCSAPEAPSALQATPGGNNAINLGWTASPTAGVRYKVERSFGACPGGIFTTVATNLVAPNFVDASVSGSVDYSYRVSATDGTGLCSSSATGCASASTTGVCNAPPVFAGLDSVTSAGTANCALNLSWSAADPNCGSSSTYSVYRGLSAAFVPALGNRIGTSIAATTFTDTDVDAGTTYYYVVRSTDTLNGAEDQNLVVRSGSPDGLPIAGDFKAGAEVGDPPLVATNGSRHIGWHWGTERVQSGLRSYSSGASASQCSDISTPPIKLVGTAPKMSFWAAFETEVGLDGGVVEISTDDGETWSLLSLPYPGVFTSADNACGFAAGVGALTGDSGPDFQLFEADLQAWQGQTIRLRFTYSSNAEIDLEGLFIDDLKVEGAEVAGTCGANSIFFDGFEVGNTSAWSLVVP